MSISTKEVNESVEIAGLKRFVFASLKIARDVQKDEILPNLQKLIKRVEDENGKKIPVSNVKLLQLVYMPACLHELSTPEFNAILNEAKKSKTSTASAFLAPIRETIGKKFLGCTFDSKTFPEYFGGLQRADSKAKTKTGPNEDFGDLSSEMSEEEKAFTESLEKFGFGGATLDVQESPEQRLEDLQSCLAKGEEMQAEEVANVEDFTRMKEEAKEEISKAVEAGEDFTEYAAQLSEVSEKLAKSSEAVEDLEKENQETKSEIEEIEKMISEKLAKAEEVKEEEEDDK